MDVAIFNRNIAPTQEQLDKSVEWMKNHRGKCPHTSERMSHALGTPISYTFRVHGLGTEVQVACNCGEKLDITDSSYW